MICPAQQHSGSVVEESRTAPAVGRLCDNINAFPVQKGFEGLSNQGVIVSKQKREWTCTPR